MQNTRLGKCARPVRVSTAEVVTIYSMAYRCTLSPSGLVTSTGVQHQDPCRVPAWLRQCFRNVWIATQQLVSELSKPTVHDRLWVNG